jgi:microcystin-dependent protein
MPYTITKSDGTQLAVIADGAVDTTTSLELPGPNYVGYGQKLNENLVYLLENFCANTAPAGVNLQGQLWFDQFNQKLNVFTQQGYAPVSGIVNSSTQPLVAHDGDIWYNQVTEQAYIYDVGAWKLIGPLYTKAMGLSGAIPDTVTASGTGQPHNIIKLQNGNRIVAIVSFDASFVPATTIDGFPRIYPGITFNSEINATINSNLTGAVTGSLVGTMTGSMYGTLSGTVTGNVTGNVTGDVTGDLTGDVTGNIVGSVGTLSTLHSTNINVTGGYATGLSDITSSTALITSGNVLTLTSNLIIAANAQISLGNVTGLTNLTSTNGNITNLSTGNLTVTSGTITGLTNFSATTGQLTNFSTANAQISGGNVTGIGSLSVTTGVINNFSTANAQITNGSITGITTLTATTGNVINLTTGNALITGGGIYNVVGANATITGANLINSVATTANASTSNTAIATTAFVHAVVPRGVIWMWNSSAATIPYGFQLCDGTNGTPDLRDRFIVGAGTTYTVGNTGGVNSVTLTLDTMPTHSHYGNTLTASTASGGDHTHTASSTVVDPGHRHSYTPPPSAPTGGYTVPGYPIEGYAGAGAGTTTGVAVTGVTVSTTITANAGHTHTTTISGNTAVHGSGQPHENRPPYYALCYIQKVI